jgi:hypothetical protein
MTRHPLFLPVAVCFLSAAAIGFSPRFASAQGDASPSDTEAASPSTEPVIEVDDAAKFGPGIFRTINPAAKPEETFAGPLELTEILEQHPEIVYAAPDFPDGKPLFDGSSRTLVELAKRVIYRREIYCFEFGFKPLRQLEVDVPNPDGTMDRKVVWYMVYRVRYRGGDLRAKPEPFASSEVPLYEVLENVSYKSRRFYPLVVLSNRGAKREYLDRVLPTTKALIAAREKINQPLHDGVEISEIDIPLSKDPDAPGVWGVATWEDVDPRLEYASVYVYGLTNAFRIDEAEGKEQYVRKTLQLNFFRPGDTINEPLDTVRFGVPAFRDRVEQNYVLDQYGLQERLDYRWVFR